MEVRAAGCSSSAIDQRHGKTQDCLREKDEFSLYNVEGRPAVTLKRQGRVSERPKVTLRHDDEDRLRQETKLVILEYLSSLPPERISARNRKEHQGSASVVKAKTIHSSERPFFDVIVKKRKSSITRRKSEEYDQKVKEKLNKMAVPLWKKLTPEVLDDIRNFDKCALKKGETRSKRRSSPFLRLAFSEKTESLDSPITSVTHRLDEIGHDIMKDYPALLDEHLAELLTPLESERKLSYEEFSVVAKSVFEQQLARFTGSVWTKVALIFYLVKEVLYTGTLTDFQVELIVEYATRFITETSADKIKKEGGWVALDPESNALLEDDLLQHDIYNPINDSRDEDIVDGNPSSGADNAQSNFTPSYFEFAKDTVKAVGGYTAAALAFGIGVAYAYFKQQ